MKLNFRKLQTLHSKRSTLLSKDLIIKPLKENKKDKKKQINKKFFNRNYFPKTARGSTLWRKYREHSHRPSEFTSLLTQLTKYCNENSTSRRTLSPAGSNEDMKCVWTTLNSKENIEESPLDSFPKQFD
mmetsp:Transcript_29067/g.33228  ORF Transcript_29067/g.33228 Transcript_29067/m.33228 type:complete len:129 (+) Transcript_29067:444-830(+)